MPVTDQQTSAAMAQAKSRLSRYLLVCFVAMLVVGMSFAGVASAQTTDSLEPNDTIEEATDVGSGAEYDDLSISSTDDVDYYAVDVEEGETITANIEFSDTEGDLDIEIEDSNGYYLASSISVTDDETVSHVAEESGTYYVRVYGFSGATADYDLNISTDAGDELEPNNDLGSATDLGTGGSYDDLEISSFDDSDYFAVEADAGQTINADIFFDDDNGDLDLELQDSDGFYLDGSTSVSDDESISYTVEESGTYYVEVYPWSGAPNSYDIDVSTDGTPTEEPTDTTGDFLEPNDDLDSATDLGSGGSYDDLEVSDFDDSDYFAVQADAGDTITADIFFDDDEGDIDMTLEDSNGYFLEGAYSVSDDESITYTVDESGTYYVEVYPFSGSPTTYDIDVTTNGTATGDYLEPNDDLDSATDLGTGGSYDDLEISSFDDSDYFAVQADSGDTITADIFFDDDNGDLDLELQDSDGFYLDGSASVSDDESISYTVEESGTYYVEVYPWSGAPNSYDIDVTTNGTSTGDDDDQIEDGVDLRSISFGESAEGTIDTSDPTIEEALHEPVTFSGEDGQFVDIGMTSETGDTYLVLQDPDGDYVAFDDDSGDGLNSLIEGYELQQTGEYTIIATSFTGDETFDYTLSLEEGDEESTSDPLEPNDDLDSATDLGTGGSYDDLEISSFDDSDFFAVQADAGDTINADIFFDDDNGDIDLELQDSDGYYLDGSVSVSDDESISYTVEESGTYYIEVYPWSGAPNSYDIDVSTEETDSATGDSLEPNDDLDSATELGSGGSYDDLEVSDFDDSDYFRVYADSGDTINADIFFEHSEGDVDMALEDSDGYFLDSSVSVTDDESISYTVDESGYYYIEVYPFSGSPTSYDIDVDVESGDDDDDQIEDGADLRSISIGESAEGTIDTLDPTVEGYYHEPVSFYGQEGTTVDISMTSETGDSYLVLEGPDGTYLTYDDDGGDGLNSEIADYELPETGTYTILATSYSGSSTFDYTLSVNSDGSNTEEPAQTNDDLSLAANSSATAGGDMLVEFTLENTGSESQAVILQAGDGVEQLGDGYSISDHSDDGGNWRDSEGSWLFDSLSGEANPSVTIDVPEDAQGTQYMTVIAESDEGNVSTTVVLDLDDIGIAQAADTNNDGELSDSEILAAIEAWQTDSTIEGTDTTVSDEEIITLISTWRSEGS